MMDNENWAHAVVDDCNEIGIVCKPESGGLLAQLYSQGRPPSEAAAIVSAHNAALDYLSGLPGLLRALATANVTLTMLKRKFDEGALSRDRWKNSVDLLTPFLNPSEQTMKHAKFVLERIGDVEMSVCFREESEAEKNGMKIVNDAYENYLKK